MDRRSNILFHYENDECALRYKRRRLSPGYSDSAQSYDELKLVQVLSGSGVWSINDREYPVAPGHILMLSRADRRHMARITSDEPLVIEYVEFLPATVHPMQSCADVFFHRPPGFSNLLGRNGELSESFARLRQELESHRLYRTEYIVHLLMGMVITAARLCRREDGGAEKSDSRYRIVCRMMVYIKEHLQEDLSRDRLARLCGVSPSYLSRLFREYSGVCLQDYIVQCRVQKAVLLLRSGSRSVLDAALESGFSSSSGFYRAFGKVTGKTPRDVMAEP